MNEERKSESDVTRIDLSDLYCETGSAQLADLPVYEETVRRLIPGGDVVVLSGPAPVWLYLRLAHALHGHAKRLWYNSPVTGLVEIFNHDPAIPAANSRKR